MASICPVFNTTITRSTPFKSTSNKRSEQLVVPNHLFYFKWLDARYLDGIGQLDHLASNLFSTIQIRNLHFVSRFISIVLNLVYFTHVVKCCVPSRVDWYKIGNKNSLESLCTSLFEKHIFKLKLLSCNKSEYKKLKPGCKGSEKM